jgi:dTDP-4-dehydrorhamnose reductase
MKGENHPMKIFVTGVNGQLGHDVMNELAFRGHEGVGSDLAPLYSGIADGTAVTRMPYVSLDITDASAVKRVLEDVHPDAVVHCAAWLWTWQRMIKMWPKSGQ